MNSTNGGGDAPAFQPPPPGTQIVEVVEAGHVSVLQPPTRTAAVVLLFIAFMFSGMVIVFRSKNYFSQLVVQDGSSKTCSSEMCWS